MKLPTRNNPNNERIANYGRDDDGGEGEGPEQVNIGPLQPWVRPRVGGGDLFTGGRGEVHHELGSFTNT